MFEFSVGLRGYDRRAVDALITRAEAALESGTAADRIAVAAEISDAQIQVAMRGYDRGQVDHALAGLGERLRSSGV